MDFEANEHHVHTLIYMYGRYSQKPTLYQVRWVSDTRKHYIIAGGRQHGPQACTVSLLPTLRTDYPGTLSFATTIFPQLSQCPPK